jgi:hypothetical protein
MARRTLLAVGTGMTLIAALTWHRLVSGTQEMQATELTTVARWLAAEMEALRRQLVEAAPQVAAGLLHTDSVMARLSPAVRQWVGSVDYAILAAGSAQAAIGEEPMLAAAAKGRSVADLRVRDGSVRIEAFTSAPDGAAGVLSATLRFPDPVAEELARRSLGAVVVLDGRAIAGVGAATVPDGWVVAPEVWKRLTASERPLATALSVGGETRLAGLAPWKDFDAWDVVGAVVVLASPGLSDAAAPLSPVALALLLIAVVVTAIFGTARLLVFGSAQEEA